MIDEDLYCPNCGYNLRGIPEDRCPECGHGYDRGAVRSESIFEAFNRYAASRNAIGYAIFTVACALAYMTSQSHWLQTTGAALAFGVVVCALLIPFTKTAGFRDWLPELSFFYWLLIPMVLFLWGRAGAALVGAGVGVVLGWITFLGHLSVKSLTAANLSEDLQHHLRRYRIASIVILSGATVLTLLCLI